MKYLLYLITILGLVGCAAADKYRQAGGTFRTGYQDAKITDNQYSISYIAQSAPEAQKNFMRRAAEIGHANGFSHFTVSGGKMGSEQGGCVGCILYRYDGTVQYFKEQKSNGYSVLDQLQISASR